MKNKFLLLILLVFISIVSIPLEANANTVETEITINPCADVTGWKYKTVNGHCTNAFSIIPRTVGLETGLNVKPIPLYMRGILMPKINLN